ncbi:MAG: hypothetical protein COA42_17475 [Alteromonadaceae bacterium]|nr:MAG: hypothetical protein COA42_17475 [Alteromonadaceae bacterium]
MLVGLWFSVDSLVSWRATLSIWREVSLLGLAFAFLLFFCSHLLRALRIQIYVFKTKTELGGEQASFLAVAKFSAMHQFSNNLLPMRLGELAFPLLARRYFGGSWQERFSQLFWLRVLDAVFVGAVLILLAGMLIVERLDFNALAVLLLLLAALLSVLWCFGLRFGSKLLDRWGWFKVSYIKHLYSTIRHYAPENIGVLARLMLCTLLAWVCKLSALAIVVQLLSQLSITSALFATLAAEISSLLPVHGVAGAGSFEAAFVGGSILTQAWDVQLVAIAVNVHLFVFFSTLIITMALLPFNIRRSSMEAVDV